MKGAIAKKIGLLKAIRQHMNKSPLTIKGYVTAVPRSVDARQARVAVIQDDVEYRFVPRGAGVDLVDGKPTKWKVENSWGNKVGHKGYFVMSDDWMDKYCYQVVINKKYLSEDLKRDYAKSPVVLKPWDPMGTLA